MKSSLMGVVALAMLCVGAAALPASAGHLFTQGGGVGTGQPLAVGQGVQVDITSIDTADQGSPGSWINWIFWGGAGCPGGNPGGWNAGDEVRICLDNNCKSVAFNAFPDGGPGDSQALSELKDFLAVGDPQATTWHGTLTGGTSKLAVYVDAGDGVCWAGYIFGSGTGLSPVKRAIGTNSANAQPFNPPSGAAPAMSPLSLALLVMLSLVGLMVFRRRATADSMI